jgi:crotonobetainyl-CoA:carnitine CoA-transferase CaiB-like acyl-CoA transferase
MGVASALVKKDRTGEGSVIDVSLLGMASWVLAGDLLAALHGVEPVQDPGRSCTTNPLTNTYRTRDGHWISLGTMQADRYRPSLCRVLGRADLADDPRFVNVGVRPRTTMPASRPSTRPSPRRIPASAVPLRRARRH